MWIAFAIIILVILVVIGVNASNEHEEQQKKLRQAKIDQRKKAEEMFLQIKQNLIDEYGEPDNLINFNNLWEYQIRKCIIVWINKSMLYVGGNHISFTDISSYNIVDNYQIKHGKINGSLDTKTNTGSLIGRSAAGAVIGGGVGAVIGASSASKKTDLNYTQDNDKLVHDYTLIIKTKDIKNPTIQFSMGDKWKKVAEVESILDILISQNTES
jgi:hypothetical protein